jgi:hypothetical protein
VREEVAGGALDVRVDAVVADFALICRSPDGRGRRAARSAPTVR